MTEPTTVAPSRRGRPRPLLTLERDKAVAAKMAETSLEQDWTEDEVAAATGLDKNVVHHCLNRLTWSGNVVKVGRGKFRRTDTEYSSEYTQRPERQPKAD